MEENKKEPEEPIDEGCKLGNYMIGKTIGEGTFGKVRLGIHTLTNEKVAVKILEKEKIKEIADVERVTREIFILKLIRHPNIVQLYEIIETPKNLFFIMEHWAKGELFDYIVAQGRLKEKEACKFLEQILSGVEYIHKLNFVHRDLKPENLLLDENMDIKIVDFGLSNIFQDQEMLKTAWGSPWYAAPEMVAGKKYVPACVDIWSCGIILYAMVWGYLPFEDPDTSKLYQKILSGDFEVPEFMSPLVEDLLHKILNTDPKLRYTIADIRNHEWFLKYHSKEPPKAGIYVGYNKIPIDDEVVNMLNNFDINSSYAKKLLGCRHNDVTTWYYLLMKKMKKDWFPTFSESPRTLKKKRIEKEDQKYAASFIEDSKFRNKSKENRSGSIKDRISNSNYVVSNDELNSSLKREIDQSNLSSPHATSSNASPIKHENRAEISRRFDSNDSENKSNKNMKKCVRPITQYRKSSNEGKNILYLDDKNSNKKIHNKWRKDSQETYKPNVDNIRLSHNDWNSKISNGVFSPNKNPSNLDQSDYNHFEMLAWNTATSGLNNTQNLKLCDYLKISDSKPDEHPNISSIIVNKSKGNKKTNLDESQRYGSNIHFESLSAVARIFSDDFKADQDSELDFEEDKINHTQIEKITEENLGNIVEKRNSQPEMGANQNENLQSNILLVNAIKRASKKKIKQDPEAVWNSVIIERERIKYKNPKGRHSKKPGINPSNRKFHAKNKRESDSLILYNDDYKDHIPK